MDICECLEDEACGDGVDIVECDFKSPRIKGLYCNGSIGISSSIKTSEEKSCIIAEELGHHHTSVGNIIDMSDTQNRKQERQARLWGYNRLIGLRGLIDAFEHGCQGRTETAEYLEVTEEYLQDCVDCYQEKYGIGTRVDNYYIMFIPCLSVGKLI
jgi:hypothetical protein